MNFDITTKEVFAVMRGRVHDAIREMEMLRGNISDLEGRTMLHPALKEEKRLKDAGIGVQKLAIAILKLTQDLRVAATKLYDTGGLMQEIHANDGAEKTEATAKAAEDNPAEPQDQQQAAESS